MSASVARVSTIRKALAALDAGLADLEVRRDRLIVTEMAAVLESLAGIKPGSVVVGVEEVQCPGPDLPAFGGGVAELAHVAADLAQQVRELALTIDGAWARYNGEAGR